MIPMHRDNASDEIVEIETEIEIEIGGWSMQRLEGLLHLIKKLKLDK